MIWFQRSLHRRVLAALAFVVLFSIVTLGAVAYITQRDALEKQFSAQLNATIDSKREQIRTWLAERKSDVVFLSENHFTRQQLAIFLQPATAEPERATAADILRETLSGMQRSRADYSRILIADPAGQILISPEQSLVGKTIANLAALEGTLAADSAVGAEVYVQRIQYNAKSGIYEMCFGRVIHAPAGEDAETSAILGVLLITADMTESVYSFLDDWPTGDTGTTVLSQVEDGGTRILNQVRYDTAKPLERLLPMADEATAKPAQLAALGADGTKMAIDHLGESVITVYRYIPELQWGLVLKMNTSEIFAPLYALLTQVALIAAGVLLLSTLIAFPIARTLTNPIREFVRATHAVGGGDLSVSVPTKRHDEIGLLARSFRSMVESVDRHQQQMKAVNQIATGILGARPCDEALYDLIQAACRLTNAEGAAIILDDYDGQNGLQLLAPPEFPNDDATVVTQVDGSTALYTTRSSDAADVDVHSLLTATPANSPDLITTPIWGQDRQLGTLLLYKRAAQTGNRSENENAWSRSPSLSISDKEILVALANYAAVAIENARLVNRLQRWNHQLEHRVVERTRELERANLQLTQLDEMKTEFIYNVSHELRNPLTNLKLQSDLLRNNIDSPRRERYVNAIIKQVDLMSQLIGDMLDLIQLDKMQNQIEFRTVDLNVIVADVVQKYDEQFQDRSIHFGFDLTEYPLLVTGEQVQLRRAINHLVRNAISYTTGGTICIRTFHRNGRIGLQVQDTGIGIAEADLPHIFQRFFRGSNVSQSTIPGSGLGLSLVREVAKLHSGDLDVESRLNHGSTFCLWFPAPEPEPVPERVAVAR